MNNLSHSIHYTTDQIGSTRIVTDDVGNMVYAAAHDPYGGVQQTWVNTFNPELKFSGKEHDTESGLYYFGARYYDPTLYRFLSPDPAIPTDGAMEKLPFLTTIGQCLKKHLMAGQISQVLFGFAALDWLSEFYYFHFYWVYIYDPPNSNQAQAN